MEINSGYEPLADWFRGLMERHAADGNKWWSGVGMDYFKAGPPKGFGVVGIAQFPNAGWLGAPHWWAAYGACTVSLLWTCH